MKTLTLVFYLKDNRVLLAMKKRGYGVGLWNGIGGKLEKGESPIEAAIRECLEETKTKPLNLIPSAELIFVDQADEDLKVVVFTCRQWEGVPRESEEMRPRWFNADKLPLSKMWEGDSHWLPRLLSGEHLRGTISYREGKLVDADVSAVSGSQS